MSEYRDRNLIPVHTATTTATHLFSNAESNLCDTNPASLAVVDIILIRNKQTNKKPALAASHTGHTPSAVTHNQ